MWHNHPFSQINNATKREVRVEVGGKGVGQNLKIERGR